MSGAELQAARKRAAERFEAIAAKYVPEGWTVQYCKSLWSGRCIYKSRTIVGPRPVTRKALYIFLHECGHAHRHAPLYAASKSAYRKKPKHVIELEAEQWAHEKMRENGVPVPKAMTKSAKAYVARKIRQAERNGAKHINQDARQFAKRSAKGIA
jgi:hypothetical protein